MPTIREELASIGDQIKALEERKRELYRQSLKAPAEEKACPDYMAELLRDENVSDFLEYPVELSGIHQQEGRALDPGWRKAGMFVAIRLCDPGCGGKTFLGVYLGDLATGVNCSLHRPTGILSVGFGWHNPAIYVPDLKRVVLGAESWWGEVRKPEDLNQISDADISNIWYVKALSALEG